MAIKISNSLLGSCGLNLAYEVSCSDTKSTIYTIEEWIDKELDGYWSHSYMMGSGRYYFYFEQEEDAFAFKLRWE